jgi:alanine dehydrogenase
MPGAYARTSTYALNNATLGYGLKLAEDGVEKACRHSEPLRFGLNTYKGQITYKAVAEAFNMMDKYTPVEKIIDL